MDPWHIWLLLGLILMAAEVLTGGFVLLLFGVACLAGLRPFLLRWTRVPEQPSNVDALSGRTGVVVQAAASEQAARVKIGGEDWRARHRDGKPLAVGAAITVAAVEGATLVVLFTEADDLETAGD
jgi:membrane protein implicated in regulation of membrane protease activity